MDWLFFLRWLHIIGASVLLGTGAGIAFFMLMAHRTGDAKLIAHTASTVVIADWIFTTTAVILQPVTGLMLAIMVGWPLDSWWILASLALYVITGLFWVPVVWIQHRLRDLARAADRDGTELSLDYHRLFRIWFAFGFPAFFAVMAIIWLMITKP